MDDTIYRQDAIDCLCNGKCTEEGRWCDDGDCMPVRRINSLPSAESEPCEDAVSRQVAIDTLLKWMRPICINNGEVVESDDMVAIRNILKSLPPAQPEQKWIPCSPETMPKKTDYYLVQYTRKYCRDEMAVAFYSVEEARCDDDYTWEIETFSDIKEVIAWMPLPKPYEER